MLTFRQFLCEDEGEPHYHITPTRNVKGIMERGLEPKIGPRSKRLGEKSHGVYLFKSLGHAGDALTNWLGDEYPESHKLALLKVHLPKDHPTTEGAGYETVATETIHPRHIRVLHRDLDQVHDFNSLDK
jgi:hypothetical protein